MKKVLALAAVLSAALAIGIVPASAITDGELDGNGHAYVGLVTFYDADGIYLWRCSATLMSPTVLLTAGHCTEAPAHSAQVWFDQGPIDAGNYPLTPIEDRPPCAGYTGWPCTGGAATGEPHPHPSYDPNAFFLRDIGVVELDSSVTMGTYGALPRANVLDSLINKRGQQDATFTAVGYGLQKSFPDAASWKDQAVRVRMVSHPKVNKIDALGKGIDFAMILSNNTHTGGTCFGDSGGPNFIGSSNVVGGITSFGRNDTCAGTGGAYRVDRSWNLMWLATYGLTPPS